MSAETDRSDSAKGSLFPPTRWTQVSTLRKAPDSPEGRRALEELCQTYWYPVYAFARRKGQAVADAQDLTQGFFAKILSAGFFENASSTEGRLRSYLLTSFTRHMADEWDKSQARKRGGGVEILSLDFDEGEQRYLHEPTASSSLEHGFDRAWARSILDQAGMALEEECAHDGKSRLFAELAPLITGNGEMEPYETISVRVGISPDALRQSVRRLRLRFRDLLRQTVADTLDTPDDAAIDDELRTLRAILAG